MSGRILVGNYDGVHVLRFEGDVRVTLCGSIDHYLDTILAEPDFACAVVDLTAAVAIDSTSLGVLAKLSLAMQRQCGRLPTLVCVAPDILRILRTMGFDDVFVIVDEHFATRQDLAELPVPSDLVEQEMRRRVIEAHRILMGLNEYNRKAFTDLVSALEAEQNTLSLARGV